MVEVHTERAVSSGAKFNTAGSVIFVGHARLPQSLSPRESSPVVSVELEAVSASGEILSVGASAVPNLGTKLLTALLVGHNINESPEPLVAETRRRHICPSQKAVSTAVLNAFEAYQRYIQVGLQ